MGYFSLSGSPYRGLFSNTWRKWSKTELEVMAGEIPSWRGMDIPNEIERVHELYASRIDVLWQCQGRASKHIEQKEWIQRKG